MKTAKLLLSTVLCAATVIFAAGGCAVEDKTEVMSSQTVSSDTLQDNDEPYKIGIVQYAEQPSLDTVREAFMSRLEEWDCDETQVEIDYQNAGGDSAKAKELCENMVQNKTDLIVAISDPAAQAAAEAAKNTETEVIFAAADMNADAAYITGTKSGSTATATVDLALQTTPEIKTVGLLYNPEEVISKAETDAIKKYCAEKNVAVEEVKVSVAEGDRTAEITEKVTALCGKADVIITPIDSMVSSVSGIISTTVRKEKKQWYATELAMAERGALAAVSIDYTKLGYETADMAVELMGGRKLAQVSAVTFDSPQVYINQTTMSAVQVTFPEEIVKSASFVTDSAQQ